MAITAGDKLPSVTLHRMTESGPDKVKTDEFFAGKTVVLFAVPGAYTPTCSARHLPGFIERAEELHGKKVDLVACVAVNDVFVMDAWGKSAGAGGKVEMLADGNGEFTKAIGQEIDASGFGMGIRSARYAMIIDDNEVREIFVEQPGAFEVSSAENVLEKL